MKKEKEDDNYLRLSPVGNEGTYLYAWRGRGDGTGEDSYERKKTCLSCRTLHLSSRNRIQFHFSP